MADLRDEVKALAERADKVVSYDGTYPMWTTQYVAEELERILDRHPPTPDALKVAWRHLKANPPEFEKWDDTPRTSGECDAFSQGWHRAFDAMAAALHPRSEDRKERP